MNKTILIPAGEVQNSLAQRVSDRLTFNAVGNLTLERYFDIISDQRNTLRRTFDQKELSALLDACNGVWNEPITLSVTLIELGVSDALDLDGLAVKWKIDGPALIAKLTALSQFERLALIDWIERTWQHPERDWSKLKDTI